MPCLRQDGVRPSKIPSLCLVDVVLRRHKLLPRLQRKSVSTHSHEVSVDNTHLDLWRVSALDVWQWVQVELLLQCLGEQDGEFGVVDKLQA